MTCNKCLQDRSPDQFEKTRKTCRLCRSEYRKQNGISRSIHGTAARLRHAYGMTIEQFNSMKEKRGGVCKICHKPPKSRRGRLAVDHDHSTGKVRGLLCDPCNRGLGQFQNDPQLLEKATAYLRSL